MSGFPWEGFGPGPIQGAPTKAKPEIWKEPAKFKELQDKLMAETAKLQTVAMTGDEAAFKAQVGATGKACGTVTTTSAPNELKASIVSAPARRSSRAATLEPGSRSCLAFYAPSHAVASRVVLSF